MRTKARARARIADIERKVRELETMKATLEELVAHCHGDDRPDCPILRDLAHASAPATAERPGGKSAVASAPTA